MVGFAEHQSEGFPLRVILQVFSPGQRLGHHKCQVFFIDFAFVKAEETNPDL